MTPLAVTTTTVETVAQLSHQMSVDFIVTVIDMGVFTLLLLVFIITRGGRR